MLFTKIKLSTWACCSILLAGLGVPAHALNSPTSIFAPDSTPARSIFGLSVVVLSTTAIIFVAVFGLLVYAVVKFRQRKLDDDREPPQVYGSTQIELAWTIIPILIVLVLFLASARVVVDIQNAKEPHNALDVTVVGHPYWWEYRYSQYNVVTANELHVPVSDPAHPTPTFLTLLSVDTDHSFWVPRLAGKTDLIPNHPNHIWIDPQQTGVYLGQCAQYCGIQHAKMLLRVYVQTQADFEQVTFLACGLLFCLPVIQQWSECKRPRWFVPLYLFLATLPCDTLSAFLTFCGRVVYSSYASGAELINSSALRDQECAGVTMWVWVTFVYLVPAIMITIQELSAGAPLPPAFGRIKPVEAGRVST